MTGIGRSGAKEAAEAVAMHAVAEMLGRRPGVVGLSREVAGQVAQVLHMTANELGAGRGVPIPVRRAVGGLADAVRRELDPRE